jgi:hypothetical protein
LDADSQRLAGDSIYRKNDMYKRLKAAGFFLIVAGLGLHGATASAEQTCNASQLLADWESVPNPYTSSQPVSGLSNTIRFSILSPSGSFFIASAGLQAITMTCNSADGTLRATSQGDMYVVQVDPNTALLQVDRLVGGQYWGRTYYAKQRLASYTLGAELFAAGVVTRGVYYSSFSAPATNMAAYVTGNAAYIPVSLATLQQLQADIGTRTSAGLRPFTIQTFAEK